MNFEITSSGTYEEKDFVPHIPEILESKQENK